MKTCYRILIFIARLRQRLEGFIFVAARRPHPWPFYQLEEFVRYKAESQGKYALLVDARYTSQKCSNCGHTYKGNREGSAFRCRKCGFELHADLNASRNIAQAGRSCLSRLSCQPAQCIPT
jgi:putative transposase